MNNILITGCAGFIASHIVEELLKNSNINVIGIDNFHSGTKANLDFIKSVDKNNNFTFIELDIIKLDKLNTIIKKYNIKQIYHLAAIVSVQESIRNPILSYNVNIKGTINILETSRLNNVKRIVFSSSAAVYGDEPTQPKNETSSVKPISPYGLEKLVGEYYMKLYSELYGLETIVLRYFNVYGERQNFNSDYSGVISIFDNKFKNGEKVNIYGDGTQYRDFIYVKDIVKINIMAMNIDNISNEIFCVGTANKTSVKKLFDIMNKKYNKNLNPQYLNSRNGDIKESVCDNSKVKQFLNIDSFLIFNEQILKI